MYFPVKHMVTIRDILNPVWQRHIEEGKLNILWITRANELLTLFLMVIS